MAGKYPGFWSHGGFLQSELALCEFVWDFLNIGKEGVRRSTGPFPHSISFQLVSTCCKSGVGEALGIRGDYDWPLHGLVALRFQGMGAETIDIITRVGRMVPGEGEPSGGKSALGTTLPPARAGSGKQWYWGSHLWSRGAADCARPPGAPH